MWSENDGPRSTVLQPGLLPWSGSHSALLQSCLACVPCRSTARGCGTQPGFKLTVPFRPNTWCELHHLPAHCAVAATAGWEPGTLQCTRTFVHRAHLLSSSATAQSVETPPFSFCCRLPAGQQPGQHDDSQAEVHRHPYGRDCWLGHVTAGTGRRLDQPDHHHDPAIPQHPVQRE